MCDMNFELLLSLAGPLLLGHLFSQHSGFDPGRGLRRVGAVQYSLHWLYAKLEPHLMRLFDRLIRKKAITDTRAGLLFLNALCRLAFLAPHSIPVTTEAAENFLEYITKSEGPKGARLGVGPCVCQWALGRRLGLYYKDLVVLYGADIYYHLNMGYRLISLAEAKKILRECETAGLVHCIDLCMRSGKYVFVMCNCEDQICPAVRLYRLTGKFIWPGPHIVSYDASLCVGQEHCGRCLQRCMFDAITVENGKVSVDYGKCVGCGLCVSTCLGNAKKMVPRDGYKHDHHVPSTILLRGKA